VSSDERDGRRVTRDFVRIRKSALAANDRVAGELRDRFRDTGTLVLNLVSAPGSGKTTLLEQTVRRLRDELSLGVLEGDVATELDAERIRALGVPARQIVTGGACHLESRIVRRALEEAEFPPLDILFIENVGNLVCPTSYDLGEDFKVALVSVPEGDDKPFKYPGIFRRALIAVVTKVDLLPHFSFDLDRVRERVATLNPAARFVAVSSTTGEGVDAWCDLLREALAAKREGRPWP